MITGSSRARTSSSAASWRRTAIALFCALFTALPAHASEAVSIPFDITNSGHMTTEIHLQGHGPSQAIIDTGANFAMFDVATLSAAGIGLPSEPEEVRVLGLTGYGIFPSLTIPHVGLPGLDLSALPAVQHTPGPRPWPTNVLPLSALQGRVAEIDFAKRTLSLYDGPPRRRVNEIAARLELQSRAGIWFAKVRLNGRSGWALIDTGSNVTYVNSTMAAHSTSRHHQEGEIKMKGATEGAALASTMRVRTLRLGRHKLSGFEILVADPPLFEHLGIADEPSMVLGLDLLRHFRVQIDRERGHMILSRPNRSHFTHSIYR